MAEAIRILVTNLHGSWNVFITGYTNITKAKNDIDGDGEQVKDLIVHTDSDEKDEDTDEDAFPVLYSLTRLEGMQTEIDRLLLAVFLSGLKLGQQK